MPAYEAARANMVENQVRPNRVTDRRVLDAMAAVPRERFVPKNYAGIAYVDEAIAVSAGRYLMEPMVLARLLQAAAIDAGDVVLDIGCATGYSTAVLARLADTVVAVESDAALVETAHPVTDLDNAEVDTFDDHVGHVTPRSVFSFAARQAACHADLAASASISLANVDSASNLRAWVQ